MDDKKQWVDNVMNSLNGSQRAKPRPELWARVQEEIGASKTKMVPMVRVQIAAAAALILLTLNVSILIDYAQSQQQIEMVMKVQQETEFFLNYNFYE